MSRDVIIHYDEAAGKIVCSTVEHASVAPLLAKALPLETSLEEFKARGPDEAERSLGAGVFALLDLSAKQKIGIRDYKAATAKWETENAAELQQRMIGGDATAMYEQALEFISVGLRAKSKKKMKEADQLLQKAAAAGNTEAAEYLTELWPALKARSEHFK
jgi:hypothetical protein